MKHLKALALVTAAAMVLTAFLGAGTASATTLKSGGTTLKSGSEILTTLAAGTSSLFKTTSGSTVETCSESENQSKTTNETGAAITGVSLRQATGGCTHTADVTKLGELKIEWTSGNNGTLYGINNEYTYQSTVLGISCTVKTSTGTPVGTLTGTSSGNATMDINGVLGAGICGDAVWTATYTVTSPSPLAVTN